MQLLTLGINHSTASVALREKLAFAPENLVAALQGAKQQLSDGVSDLDEIEVLLVSTCNRTEIVAVGELSSDSVVAWLASFHGLEAASFMPHLYQKTDADALRHLISVASGLDSMVLGEPQIFGQLKSAYAVAQEAGTIGSRMDRIFRHTFSVAKKVRSSTAIGENPVSVAYAAVALSQRIFSDLSGVSALLLGAGETIELVARHLIDAGVSSIVVANRTLTRARELADQLGAREIMLADVPDNLAAADIVISSTASQLPVLGKGAVERALRQRKRRPIFMVDLAVPRDIEPQVADLSDIYLYCVDDLHDIIDQNKQLRVAEVDKASAIIEQGVGSFLRILRSRSVDDVVVAYRQSMESMRDRELQKAQALLQAGKQPDVVVEQLARSLTNKFMHSPTVEMRSAAERGQREFLDTARALLGLVEDSEE